METGLDGHLLMCHSAIYDPSEGFVLGSNKPKYGRSKFSAVRQITRRFREKYQFCVQ